MLNTRFLLFTLTLITFFACGEKNVYDKKHIFAQQQWTYQDSINFDFEIKDTFKIYNLFVEVEHQENYPYQNIYVMTHTKFPTGERPSQRINIDLAKNSGELMGKKSGKNYTQTIDLQENAYFDKAGNYTLTLSQFMRQDSLPLQSIRFYIEDTEKTRSDVNVKKGNRPAKDEKYKVR